VRVVSEECEWLGWCRYGVPCDDPTTFWVTATIADGPVDDVAPFVDDGKSKKKSTSRASQREREMSSISETKQSHDKNTILAHHSFQVDEELRINSTNHDLCTLTHTVHFLSYSPPRPI
jgi:hypothetical protein